MKEGGSFAVYSQTSFIRTAWCLLKCVRIVKHADYWIVVNRTLYKRLPGSMLGLWGIRMKEARIKEVSLYPQQEGTAAHLKEETADFKIKGNELFRIVWQAVLQIHESTLALNENQLSIFNHFSNSRYTYLITWGSRGLKMKIRCMTKNLISLGALDNSGRLYDHLFRYAQVCTT